MLTNLLASTPTNLLFHLVEELSDGRLWYSVLGLCVLAAVTLKRWSLRSKWTWLEIAGCFVGFALVFGPFASLLF